MTNKKGLKSRYSFNLSNFAITLDYLAKHILLQFLGKFVNVPF